VTKLKKFCFYVAGDDAYIFSGDLKIAIDVGRTKDEVRHNESGMENFILISSDLN